MKHWIFALIVLFDVSFAMGQEKKSDLKTVKEAQLLIFEDLVHGHPQDLEYQSIWLKVIKDAVPEYDCLLSEVEPRLGLEARKFLNGASYQASVQTWIDRTDKEDGMSFRNILPEYFLSRIKKIGMTVVGVDMDFQTDQGKKVISLVKTSNQYESEFREKVIFKRNEIMAKNIISALRSGSCRKAVFVVGGAHLLSDGAKSVLQYLDEAGIAYHQMPVRHMLLKYDFSKYDK